jgi:hypothetical protein
MITTETPKPASELFVNVIRSSGSIVIDCELCGRTHFGNGGDYEEGEFENLQAKARSEPDKYIFHGDYDMVSYGYICGKQAVLDCPCNELAKYERFIWSHRDLISRYFVSRADEQLRDASQDSRSAHAARESVRRLQQLDRDSIPQLTFPKGRQFQFD